MNNDKFARLQLSIELSSCLQRALNEIRKHGYEPPSIVVGGRLNLYGPSNTHWIVAYQNYDSLISEPYFHVIFGNMVTDEISALCVGGANFFPRPRPEISEQIEGALEQVQRAKQASKER